MALGKLSPFKKKEKEKEQEDRPLQRIEESREGGVEPFKERAKKVGIKLAQKGAEKGAKKGFEKLMEVLETEKPEAVPEKAATERRPAGPGDRFTDRVDTSGLGAGPLAAQPSDGGNIYTVSPDGGISARSVPTAPTIDEGATYRAYIAEGGGYGDLGGAVPTKQPMGSLELGQVGGPGGTTPGGQFPMGDMTTNQLMISGLLDAGFSPDEIQQVVQGMEILGTGGPALPPGDLANAPPAPPGQVGGTGGPSGGLSLGGVGNIAGWSGLGLNLIGQLAGSPELAKAGSALGMAGSGIGLANLGTTIGSGLASGVVPAAWTGLGGAAGAAAGGTAATAGAAGSATAGAGALGGAGLSGLGTAAGAAFAPVAAMMLAWSIANMVEPGSAPDIMDMFGTKGDIMGQYPFFSKKVANTLGQQAKGFSTLEQALPFVQSKEELGQLLNTAGNYIQTTTGVTPEWFGPAPYGIPKTPGTGPRVHGQAITPVDWGPRTQQLLGQVNALLPRLSGEQITARYGEPGGGLEGEAARRLWQQFHLTPPGETSALPVYAGAGQPYKQFTPEEMESAFAQGTFPREPSWDPQTGEWVAGGGVPKPSDFFKPNPATAGLFARGGPGGIPATGGVGVSPQGSTGFASLLGPRQELRGAEDPNRL